MEGIKIVNLWRDVPAGDDPPVKVNAVIEDKWEERKVGEPFGKL